MADVDMAVAVHSETVNGKHQFSVTVTDPAGWVLGCLKYKVFHPSAESTELSIKLCEMDSELDADTRAAATVRLIRAVFQHQHGNSGTTHVIAHENLMGSIKRHPDGPSHLQLLQRFFTFRGCRPKSATMKRALRSMGAHKFSAFGWCMGIT